MWQWFLAGALVLLNLATILIVMVVVRLHLRRVGWVLGEARRGHVPADETAAQATARAEALRKLLAELDVRIAELRRLSGPGADGRHSPAAESRRDEIRRLANQGIDPVGIAQRLDMHVGEVELMVHLDRSASGAASGMRR